MTARNDDQEAADRERRARSRLMQQGAGESPRQPWRPSPIPPSAVELVEFALWREQTSSDREAIEAGLGLVAAARAEIAQLEVGVLFAARGHGMTWDEIARAMGLHSPQAVQQRLGRLRARGETP